MLGKMASWAGILWMASPDAVVDSGSGETSAIPAVVVEVAQLIRSGNASIGLDDADYPEGLDRTKRSPVGNYADKTRKRVARALYPDMDADDAHALVSSAIRNVGTKKAPQFRAWIVLNERGQANPPKALQDDTGDDTDA